MLFRSIAVILNLNADLTDAIALGHDLGHTPFGHNGEAVLNAIHPGGFRHNEQSLRVVDLLEEHKDRRGMNLTYEVRDGIVNHTGPVVPDTAEGQVVRISDRIAYINHDIDDAVRSKVITAEDIPESSLVSKLKSLVSMPYLEAIIKATQYDLKLEDSLLSLNFT